MKTPRSGTPGLITLASIGEAGYPELRTVVLQSIDRDAGTVETFTDSETPKVTEFIANSKASVLIWQPVSGLQIRLLGNCRVIQGDDALSEWENVPEIARKNYGVTPSPGSVIAGPGDYKRIPHPDRLTNLEITISQMDVVHLAKPYDIRAKYHRQDGWAGEWLAP
ncbi:MAG: pyridoxamine 5'-phosphate oxidase family protein [Paracoccaceae bacterium]